MMTETTTAEGLTSVIGSAEHRHPQLATGDIVQLNPHTVRNPMFAGCLLVVTEPKAFGCQGYVQMTGQDGSPGGQAYYRARWDEFEPTGGTAVWVPGYGN